jgi:hypothetical protein
VAECLQMLTFVDTLPQTPNSGPEMAMARAVQVPRACYEKPTDSLPVLR